MSTVACGSDNESPTCTGVGHTAADCTASCILSGCPGNDVTFAARKQAAAHRMSPPVQVAILAPKTRHQPSYGAQMTTRCTIADGSNADPRGSRAPVAGQPFEVSADLPGMSFRPKAIYLGSR